MNHILRLILPFLFVICVQIAFGDVRQAIKNAQAGLDEALQTEFPSEKKYVRLEKRDDGTLVYKVSMRRVDEQTIRFRIIGYDGSDEVSIITSRIIYGSSYKTISEYKRLKQTMLKKRKAKDAKIGITEEKKGDTDDQHPTH